MDATFAAIIKDAKVTTRGNRKHAKTPEQLAQEPVYCRFSKAQFETLEEKLWEMGLLEKGRSLSPAIVTDWIVTLFEKNMSVDLRNVRKTLARPNLVRR